MTAKQIEKELQHFKDLPYSIQYWCFQYFIVKNIKQADYFIELIKNYQKK